MPGNNKGAIQVAVGLLAALWWGAWVPCSLSAEGGGNIAIIVNPEVTPDNLNFAEVRRIFLGERQFWSPGLKVTLLVRAPVAHERDVVLNTIYRMTESQFRQYWIAKVFRAEIPGSPKVFYSNEMATELVSVIPGAIGFVDAAHIPRGVKVLKIDGLLPGDKGYRLRQ